MMNKFQNHFRRDDMSFDKNFLQIRKQRGLTQDQMSAITGVHVNSVKVYEAGKSQPSLDVFKRIAVALSVSADELLFDQSERGPDDNFKLAFEAVTQMPEKDRQTILSLIESMVVKNQVKILADDALNPNQTAKATGT